MINDSRGLVHSADLEEINDLEKYINDRLPATEEGTPSKA